MTIDFYYFAASPPCRMVLLAAKAVGVELNLKILDHKKQEHLTPEFLKINPQHSVPTIVDNGFALWESRAIITYLQNQYGQDDSIYPKDAKQRALVDQRLNFDASTLYPGVSDHYFPVVFYGATSNPEKLENIDNALKLLDGFLEESEFVAGNNLTLADLAIVATISTYDAFGHDLSPYKNITRWYSKVKETAPGYEEANNKLLENFRQLVSTGTKE